MKVQCVGSLKPHALKHVLCRNKRISQTVISPLTPLKVCYCCSAQNGVFRLSANYNSKFLGGATRAVMMLFAFLLI